MTLQAVAIQPALDTPAPGLEPGALLAGRYRLGEALGEGGMCLVFAAVDERLERDVAVKVLRPERSSPELVRRFVIEARTLAALDSPHLVEVLDLGAVQMPDGTRLPFMVLERLSGCDLRRYCDERGPLELSFIVTAVLQACEGIASAHAAGIVHRDLKPENLFVLDDAREGEFIKVLDFGIARLPRESQNASLTFEGEQMGSPGYTAPEQLCNARDVDPRTDIWSLGVVLYELLGGAPPFEGGTQREVCANILMGRVVPLSKRNGDLPRDLVTAVHRCVDSDRRRRFNNVAELARSIYIHAGPEGIDYVRRIERRLGLPVTLDPRSGSARDSVSRITPIPRAQAPIASPAEPAAFPAADDDLDIPIVVSEEIEVPPAIMPEDSMPRRVAFAYEDEPTLEYDYSDDDEDEAAPPPPRRARRALAYVLFALLLIPALALAAIAVASRFPQTAAWSERTAVELQERARALSERARTALFGE
jgi:serine/threonine protein kinase